MAAVAATVIANLEQQRLPLQAQAPSVPFDPRKELAQQKELGRLPKTVLDLDDLSPEFEVSEDFAGSALRHLSEAVRELTAEHNRRMALLRKENQEMSVKLSAALEEQQRLVKAGEQLQAMSQNTSASSSSDPGRLGQSRGTNGDGRIIGNEGDMQDSANMEAPRPPAQSEPRQAVAPPGSPKSPKAQNIEEELEQKPRTLTQKIHQLVLSPKFDSIIGAVIIGNTLIMSLQLEYHGRVFKDEKLNDCAADGSCSMRNQGIETIFEAFEHCFTGIFTLELILRVCLVRGYLRRLSNLLDAAVVLVSMADSWVLAPLGSNVFGSVAVLRLIRLMRLAKVLRVVRVMKAFKSLRILVAAVVNSVGALGWSMTLLFVLKLVGAIFMAQVIQPFMEDSESRDLQEFIWDNFGTWTNSMFTMFEITMAPGGFIKYRRLYEEVHPAFGAFFVIYVCIVTFAVVRVITAMFLKATLSASDSEEQETAKERSQVWKEYLKDVQANKELAESDADGSGFLGLEELEDLLAMEHFSKWLRDVGVAADEVIRMFNALDTGGTHEVVFIDFELALQQMSGLPRAANSVLNLYETRDICRRVIKLEARFGNPTTCALQHGQTAPF